MLALGLDAAKQLAIAIVVVVVVLALISATVIKKVTTKVITTLLLLGLALGVWTQRADLVDCTSEVRAKAAALDTSLTSCTLFGREVSLGQVNGG